MQTQTKQRLIGAFVIVGITAIFLPILFHHPLPGFKKLNLSAGVPNAPEQPQKVYDLYVQQGKLSLQRESFDQNELVSNPSLSDEELRSRAEKTDVVSNRLLHTPQVSENLALTKVQKNVPVFSKKEKLNHKVFFHSPSVVPKAWVVQLATFSNKKNAEELVKKLRKMHLDAFSRKISLPIGTTLQVYVGPYIQLDAAKTLQKDLKYRLHLNGVIKKYTLS